MCIYVYIYIYIYILLVLPSRAVLRYSEHKLSTALQVFIPENLCTSHCYRVLDDKIEFMDPLWHLLETLCAHKSLSIFYRINMKPALSFSLFVYLLVVF